MNPLDAMTWEERFYAAFHALLKEQARVATLRRQLAAEKRKVARFWALGTIYEKHYRKSPRSRREVP